MSIEAWVNKDIFVCGLPLRTKEELKEAIKDCEDTMKYIKERLKTYIFMTEPSKFIPADESPMYYLDREFNELMDDYDSEYAKLIRLWEFENAWDDCHDANGKAILPVNPLELKRRDYMGGDYMEAILEDGTEVPEDWWDVYHGFIKPEESSFAEKLGLTPVKRPEPVYTPEEQALIDHLNSIKVDPIFDKKEFSPESIID